MVSVSLNCWGDEGVGGAAAWLSVSVVASAADSMDTVGSGGAVWSVGVGSCDGG